MTWPVCADERGSLARALGVRALPTHVVIDHEKIITLFTSGWSGRKENQIIDHVSKAIKAAKKAKPVVPLADLEEVLANRARAGRDL